MSAHLIRALVGFLVHPGGSFFLRVVELTLIVRDDDLSPVQIALGRPSRPRLV